MNANLYEILARSASAHPDRWALTDGVTSRTYSDLDLAAARVHGLLEADGVTPGDRVAVMIPNDLSFASIYYGALRAGATVVPMNPLLRSREVAFYLSDPEVSVLFAWEGCREVVESARGDLDLIVHYVRPDEFDAMLELQQAPPKAAHRDSADTAVILYTSGTTGTPKGAELTHANLNRNLEIALGLFTLESTDVVIGALPLFHAFGQICALNAVVSAGAGIVIVARFDPAEVLGAIDRFDATLFMGVPTMYNALLNHPGGESFDVESLRMCVSGGAALPLEVLHGFETKFGCVLLEGYGLSETSPISTFNREGQQRPGSIGVPIDGVELRILDDDGNEVPDGEIGEIAIKGHNIMKGYWRRPEDTAAVISADGWFRSGDLGRKDEDGFFYVVDRKKEMLIRGGYNVYPREIEEVLYEHPAVLECAVIGIPDDLLGEEVGAAVVLNGAGAATAEDLREFVKERVAPYKYPRHIWFVDALPKGATNKILKREIQVPATTS